MPTEAEIAAARTPAGGWTKETLAQWGVPWPPPPGWRKRLLAENLAEVVGKQAAKRLVGGKATAVVDGVPSVVVRRP